MTVDRHPARRPDVAGGVRDPLAPHGDPSGGDQLLGASPGSDARVGEVLGEPDRDL
jgi:hypothetical protein